MEPNKPYSLADFAEMNGVSYYMIQSDDIDGLGSTITSYSSFKELKKAFLENVELYPDQDNEPSITYHGLTCEYYAHIEYDGGGKVVLTIGVSKRKELEIIKNHLDKIEG